MKGMNLFVKRRMLAGWLAGCLCTAALPAVAEDALYGAGMGATEAMIELCETRSGKEAGGFLAHVEALCGAEVAAGIAERLHVQVGPVEWVPVVLADGTIVYVPGDGSKARPYGWADFAGLTGSEAYMWYVTKLQGNWFAGVGVDEHGNAVQVAGVVNGMDMTSEGITGVRVRAEDGTERYVYVNAGAVPTT